MSERQYTVWVVRAWTKEGLARALKESLDPWPRDAIVSIRAGSEPPYFFWRRNWSLIVMSDPDELND